jgi:hypothetical protein
MSAAGWSKTMTGRCRVVRNWPRCGRSWTALVC